MIRRLLLLTTLVMLAPRGASAYPSPFLAQLNPLRLLIAPLNEDAKKCGVAEDSINAAVRLVVQRTRLRLDDADTRTKGVFYVNVNVLQLPLSCAANVSVMIKDVVAGTNTNGVYALDSVTLSRKEMILSGPMYSFGRQVRDAVTDLTEAVMGEWLEKNP